MATKATKKKPTVRGLTVALRKLSKAHDKAAMVMHGRYAELGDRFNGLQAGFAFQQKAHDAAMVDAKNHIETITREARLCESREVDTVSHSELAYRLRTATLWQRLKFLFKRF